MSGLGFRIHGLGFKGVRRYQSLKRFKMFQGFRGFRLDEFMYRGVYLYGCRSV